MTGDLVLRSGTPPPDGVRPLTSKETVMVHQGPGSCWGTSRPCAGSSVGTGLRRLFLPKLSPIQLPRLPL